MTFIAQFTTTLHGENRKFLIRAANPSLILYDVRGPYSSPTPTSRPTPTHASSFHAMSPEGFAQRTGWTRNPSA